MRFTVLTLFPHLFDNFLTESIIKRAINKKLIKVEIVNFRDWSKNKLKQVDDYQIGGGGGMVIALPAIVDCIRQYKTKNSKVVLLSAIGKTYNQQLASKLANDKKYKHLILVCGHYEGFDERILHYVDEIISIGDYILTGGEIPAMIIIDSCARLVKNVINSTSLASESFNNNLLDYPVYTKPIKFEKYKVPDILLSGNHKKIDEYRKTQQILKTQKYRKDLYKKYLKENSKQKEI